MPHSFENDPRITGDARLLRRVHPQQLVPSEHGRKRVSSGAFRDYELSINIEPFMIAAGRSPADALKNHAQHSLVAITAELAREHKQIVASDPTEDESAHGVVVGNKTAKVARTFATRAEWVIPPEAPKV